LRSHLNYSTKIAAQQRFPAALQGCILKWGITAALATRRNFSISTLTLFALAGMCK